jgi:hypothetical protein
MKLKQIASNMTEVETNDGAVVLFSYSTPVAAIFKGCLIKTSQWYSATTTRHINKWLDGEKATEKSQEFLDCLSDPKATQYIGA